MQPQADPNSQPQQPTDGSDIHQFVVLQPGERVIFQIKRHPFGLLSQYITTGLLVVVALVVAILVVPKIDSSSTVQGISVLIYGALGLLVAFAVIFLAVANSIYWKNKWILTSDSLTQILKPSLFGQQVSQLSLDDLEDVTVIQSGILQTMFHFGTLRAETAGERSKFVFIYCPNPNQYARQILAAREEFMNFKRYNETAQHQPAYYGNSQEPGTPPPTPPNDLPPAPQV